MLLFFTIIVNLEKVSFRKILGRAVAPSTRSQFLCTCIWIFLSPILQRLQFCFSQIFIKTFNLNLIESLQILDIGLRSTAVQSFKNLTERSSIWVALQCPNLQVHRNILQIVDCWIKGQSLILLENRIDSIC